MNCSSTILELLNKFNIDGHDKKGGTDKNTNHSYVDVYGYLLDKFVNKQGTLLEIGIHYGGSLLLWQELLPNFVLYGVDNKNKIDHVIETKLKQRTNVVIGDAYKQSSVETFKIKSPDGYDVIIDDGPHSLESQIFAASNYAKLLKPGGILIIEDIQNFDDVEKITSAIPSGYKFEIFDRRNVKNRYDDVIICITREKINKIAIFYHVGQFGQWERLYQEQVHSLCVSGLYNACDFIYVGINGNNELPSILPKMQTVVNNNHVLESDTLKAMWDFANQNPDYRLLYIHTKGTTHENQFKYNVDAWRLYLEYFVIHCWYDCITKLKHYDCTGAEWIQESGLTDPDTKQTVFEINPHYAGNFWWANASYLKTLDPKYIYDTSKGWTRWKCEFWIGTNNPKYFNFYNTNDYCKYTLRTYSPEHYVKQIPYVEPVVEEIPTMLKNKKAKIVMISMFKNESKTIRRMLESCYKYIDYYILQDNGSTDGTPEIVADFFKDKNIPGFVYKVEEGWVGFGWNRDHVLQKCINTNHGCDWILKMDCDEILEVADSFDWSVFDDKNLHSFHVPSVACNVIYFRAWIWNARLKWKINHDVAHETIELIDGNIGQNFRRFNLPSTFKLIGGFSDGESYTQKTKYVSDALKIEEKLIKEDTMLQDMYHFWYVGKSYYDGFRETDLPLKQAHQDEFARRCIFYFKEYLNITHNFGVTGKADRIDEMGYYAIKLIGNSYRFLGDLEKAKSYLIAAEQFCPARNEHLTNLAEVYQLEGNFEKMYEITSRLVDPARKNPFPDYTFIIDTNCYWDTGNYVKQLHQTAEEKTNKKHFYRINANMNTRLWVIDNFYTNPDEVRNFALSVEYQEDNDWYKGSRSKLQHNFPGIKEIFEKIMGIKLKDLNSHGMCGRFQLCTAQENLVYHVDSQKWAAMVYLTPNAPVESGTSLLKSKITGARHASDPNFEGTFNGGFYDKTKFEVVDKIGNVYNRLIIMDAQCIHAACQYFGNTKENARLTHLFFFDNE